jgi:two-component system, OmpR family, response regulator MprA
VADVLIVEDDAMIRTALVRALSARQHSTMTAPTALEGLQSLVANRPDVVLLDLGLPDLDGSALLAMIRAVSDVPVIVVSARDDGAGIVALLDAGADDYLVKPFALEELLARLRALLRRHGDGGDALVFGDVSLDTGTREVRRGERPIELTRTEFNLLELFLRNPRQVLRRSLIYERVWGYDFGFGSNSLHVYIGYLRRKLEQGGEPRIIQTVRGVGYALRDEP